MTGYITDPLEDARSYALAWMRARENAGPELREIVWSRQGLCHAIFDMLDILMPDDLRALFEEQEDNG